MQTFAGGGLPVNIPGTSAILQQPDSVAVDGAGNVFIAVENDAVLRLDAATGILTLVAGNGTPGFSGDGGPATSAQLGAHPQSLGIAVDFAGTLYIADRNNRRIRKVSNGVIATVAGNGTVGYSGDNGPATSAQLAYPYGVAVDSADNLYIADAGSGAIRKVSNGAITTVAGNGTQGFSGDGGPATGAQLNQPSGVAVDSAGNLYIADSSNYRVRKVSNGIITTVAGNGTPGFSGDNGPATSAQLGRNFTGLAVDSAGNLYIADMTDSCIRKVSNGVITTVAGGGGALGDNGPATSARLNSPFGVAVDSTGNLYIADLFNDRIRKVSSGVIATIAGDGTAGRAGDDAPATSGQLFDPSGVAMDSVGNVYIADRYNNRIRKVSNGAIATVAGNGAQGYSGDGGPAASAQLNNPWGVAVDSADNLYIADYGNWRIRKVSNGVITTVAGNGTPGFSGDGGPAIDAELYAPSGIAVDPAGNLYFADTLNNRVRKISNGVIATVAGSGTQLLGGYSGDGGPATSAQLYQPDGVAVDSTGNLYIADFYNAVIREVSNGVITTVAGDGTGGYSGDNGPATNARLGLPQGVTVDSAGNLYISDPAHIRKVANGVITTVAGNGTSGFSGDGGPATDAELYLPSGVAVDSAGNVYIADTDNDRIRILTPSCAPSARATEGRFTEGIETRSSCPRPAALDPPPAQ
jgi:sugar lactone lactonase YvrE